MFFYLSKFLWFVTSPDNLLVIVLGIGGLLLWTRRGKTIGRWIVLAVVGVVLLIAVFPVGQTMVSVIEDRFPAVRNLPDRVDGIVVLGGVISPVLSVSRGEEVISGSFERLLAFSRLARRYPDARLVFTGGASDPFYPEFKEARLISDLLSDLGVDVDRVVFEEQSRNTVENAILTKELVGPVSGQTWVLITSAFHMPRAVGCFRQAGWHVIPYPVDYHTAGSDSLTLGFNFAGNLASLRSTLHEYLGLFFYWLTGKTSDLFPGPER